MNGLLDNQIKRNISDLTLEHHAYHGITVDVDLFCGTVMFDSYTSETFTIHSSTSLQFSGHTVIDISLRRSNVMRVL